MTPFGEELTGLPASAAKAPSSEAKCLLVLDVVRFRFKFGFTKGLSFAGTGYILSFRKGFDTEIGLVCSFLIVDFVNLSRIECILQRGLTSEAL
jgi:hypothetical protein